MTDDTVTNVDIDQNDFEAEFFSDTGGDGSFEIGQPKPVEDAEPEVVEEVDDLGEDESDPPAPEDEDEDVQDEEEEEKPAPRKNKNPLQKRINELKAAEREAKAERDTLRAELEALKATVTGTNKDPVQAKAPEGAPDPDERDENGEAKYPLGEFDKQYIADLTKFTIDQQMAEARQKQAEIHQKARLEQAQNELVQQWAERVAEYEKEVPDLRENIMELTETFDAIQGPYGEYIATTIMDSEYGPHIMNYLSQNIGEAQKIVASGAAAATRAIGRLEAMFEKEAIREEKRNEKRLSRAPAPPENLNRGTNGRFSVRPDTDNQDAFEEMFFSKK